MEKSGLSVGNSSRVFWSALGVAVGAQFGLHALAFNGGWFRDELYYIACAKRLDWAYVDHPALSVALLRLLGPWLESLPAVRLVAAFCGVLTTAGILLLARSLGAGRATQLVAAVAAVVSPVFLGIHSFYSMNALEPLFWLTIATLWTRKLRSEHPALPWAATGLVGALAFHNKLSILWLLAPLVVASVVLLPWHHKHWGQVASFCLIFGVGSLPWWVWQYQHGFPTMEFIRNATQQKMEPTSPLSFLAGQVLAAGPLVVLLTTYGCYVGLRGVLGLAGRVLAVVVLFNAVLLAASSSSRAYYLVPAHCLGIALGAAALHLRLKRRTGLVSPLFVALLLMPSCAAIPLALPILPPERTAQYLALFPVGPPREEKGTYGPLPQHLADRYGWEDLGDTVYGTWERLAGEEGAKPVIVAANYGQASALEVLRRHHPAATVASPHNQFWYWARPTEWGDSFLLVGFPEAAVRPFFEETRPLGHFACQWCRENACPLVLARKPVQAPEVLWARLRKFL